MQSMQLMLMHGASIVQIERSALLIILHPKNDWRVYVDRKNVCTLSRR